MAATGCSSVMSRTEGARWFAYTENWEHNVITIDALRNELKNGIGAYTLVDVKNLLRRHTKDAGVASPEVVSSVDSDSNEEVVTQWLLIEIKRDTLSLPLTSTRQGETQLYSLSTTYGNDGKLLYIVTHVKPLTELEKLWSTRDLWLSGVALGTSLLLVGGL